MEMYSFPLEFRNGFLLQHCKLTEPSKLIASGEQLLTRKDQNSPGFFFLNPTTNSETICFMVVFRSPEHKMNLT